MFRKGALPPIPPTVDQHPDLATHCARVLALEGRRDATRRAITTLEAERQRVATDRADAQVLALLGEDSDAVSRVANGAAQLHDIDSQLSQLRERAAIEDEAVKRMHAREPQIRGAVTKAIQRDVKAVQRELTTLLAARLKALLPVNSALLELRRQHWDAVDDVAAFAELDPRGSRMHAWRETARRALGVDLDL